MKTARRTIGWAAGLLVLFGVGVVPAHALSFDCITNNNLADCADAEAQMQVTVAAGPGANQVSFTFTNSGPDASSITDIYFDDGTLLGIASITDGAGVNFEQGASPGDLPGGGTVTPPFEATAGFTADSEPPAQPNGVNPGEFVTIVFDLQGGGDLQDVLDELASGELRIGIHVQGFASGGSEALICCTGQGGDTGEGGSQVELPVPATLLLLGAGLIGLAVGPALRRGARRE